MTDPERLSPPLAAVVDAVDGAVARTPLGLAPWARQAGKQTHLLVHCRGRRVALRLSDIREVRPASRVAPLPAAPDWLLGLASVDDGAVAVVHLSLLLGWGFESVPWRIVCADSTANRTNFGDRQTCKSPGGAFLLAVGGVEGLTNLHEHGEAVVAGHGPLAFVEDHLGPAWLLDRVAVLDRVAGACVRDRGIRDRTHGIGVLDPSSSPREGEP